MRSDPEESANPAGDGGAAAPAAPPALLDNVQPSSPKALDPIDRRYVVAALMLVMVLVSMEMTIASTAMPTIIGDLHGLEHYSWVASIYLLTSTVSMPLYGRLSDALGRKRVLVAAISLFLVSSLLAAGARSMTQLIIFRGLQGLGAGGVMPVVLTILGDIFTLKERARIQGLFSAVWGTAALAGPFLGYLLVASLGWRSVFYVNLPLGIPGLVVVLWKYRDVGEPHSTDLDLPGVATLGLACGALLALVSRLGPGGWPWPVAAVLAAVAVGAGVYFVIHERLIARNPVLPPKLLLRRDIGPSILGSFLLGAGVLSLDTYVPFYVQGGLGGGARAAAMVVMPVLFTWAMSSVAAAPLLVRWGFRKTALAGTFLIVLGFLGLVAAAYFGAPRWVLTTTLAVTGLGFGPSSMSYLLSAQGAVQWQQRGVVTGSVSFFRTIGGAMGVGLLGALFNLLIRDELQTLRARGVSVADLLDAHGVNAAGSRAASIPPDLVAPVQQMISGALLWVFVALLVLAALQVAVTTLLPPRPADHPVSRTEAFEASV